MKQQCILTVPYRSFEQRCGRRPHDGFQVCGEQELVNHSDRPWALHVGSGVSGDTTAFHSSVQMPKASACLITAFSAFWVFSAPLSHAGELCTLVVDAATGDTVVRSGASCAQRITPASTFKVAISLMGFDSGVLQSSHRPAWPYRDGYPDWAGDAWKGDIDPAGWMKKSVFWYSQQVVKQLGQTRFDSYVASFNYGNQDTSAVQVQHPENQGVWVMSSLQISPIEQAAFLRKLVNRQLPVSAGAYEMTEEITLQEDLNGWRIYGKTGTGSPGQDHKYQADQAYGWYVGWARKCAQAMVFVRLIQDEKAQSPNAGLRARSQMSEQLLSVTTLNPTR